MFTEPLGELWGGAQGSSQADPDYRSAVKLQKKSFSCWRDCLLRTINHLGHMIVFFSFKIAFKPSNMKMKPHYDKIVFHSLSESHPSSVIRENLRLSPTPWVRPGSIKWWCWLRGDEIRFRRGGLHLLIYIELLLCTRNLTQIITFILFFFLVRGFIFVLLTIFFLHLFLTWWGIYFYNDKSESRRA